MDELAAKIIAQTKSRLAGMKNPSEAAIRSCASDVIAQHVAPLKAALMAAVLASFKGE